MRSRFNREDSGFSVEFELSVAHFSGHIKEAFGSMSKPSGHKSLDLKRLV